MPLLVDSVRSMRRSKVRTRRNTFSSDLELVRPSRVKSRLQVVGAATKPVTSLDDRRFFIIDES